MCQVWDPGLKNIVIIALNGEYAWTNILSTTLVVNDNVQALCDMSEDVEDIILGTRMELTSNLPVVNKGREMCELLHLVPPKVLVESDSSPVNVPCELLAFIGEPSSVSPVTSPLPRTS
ncbi:hypothetical protein ACFE04_016655 [Oxalis oulophora]